MRDLFIGRPAVLGHPRCPASPALQFGALRVYADRVDSVPGIEVRLPTLQRFIFQDEVMVGFTMLRVLS